MQTPDFLKATLVTAILDNRVRVNDENPCQPSKQAKEKEIKKMHEHIEPKHPPHIKSKARKPR